MTATESGTPVLHVRLISDEREARTELRKIGVDPQGIPIMAPKMRHVVIKIKDLDVRAANVLKQEMLAKGAEAAVSKRTSSFTAPTTDVLLMGTIKQYRLVLKKLKVQPFGLGALVEPIKKALAVPGSAVIDVRCGPKELSLGRRTLIMGILNITPDSFSDGGRFSGPDDAFRHALAMADEGADLIDVGGESTRPGAESVEEAKEIRRVIGIVERLARELPVPVSVDTSKAVVAEAAIAAGAAVINDVTALKGDPDMARVCAAGKVGVILMHMLGEPRTMQQKPEYADLIGDIVRFFNERITLALDAGIEQGRLFIDPGFGFGKTTGHNLEIVKRMSEFSCVGLPIVFGPSRKSTIGAVLGGLGTDQRIEGTAATVTAGILGGAAIIRAHDVKEMVRVARMTDAIKAGEAWHG